MISARQGGTQQPDAFAYGWAGALGALMLARRTHPRAVLLVTAFGLFAYYAAGYPAVGRAHHLLSPATARTYVSRLITKLNVRDRTQLAVIAHRAGLTGRSAL
ncbi:hypothetical protein Acsp02_22310 [Actinoplanes sp. NBRC 103695]|nr:hypothetical protein Acsp02_22310 [Actinoplanes sp. NBRC 103695]